MGRERNYGIDALRILSMLMVVILHVLLGGGILENGSLTGIQYKMAWAMEAACYCAVNCYGMISGYVGVKAGRRAAGTLYLVLQTAFYLAAIHLAYCALFPVYAADFSSWREVIWTLYDNYWYFTAYLLLSVMMPLLNAALERIPRSALRRGIMSCLLLVTFITAFVQEDLFRLDGGYCALWLAALYMLGGYLRLYGEGERVYQLLQRFGLAAYALSVAAIWLLQTVAVRNGMPLLLGRVIDERYLFNYVSPLVLLSGISLFAFFSAFRPGKRLSRIIGFMTPAVFGVYLVHLHPDFWNHLIWGRYAHYAVLRAHIFPFAVLGTAIVMFSGCFFVECVRIRLFDLLRVRQGCRLLAERLAGDGSAKSE